MVKKITRAFDSLGNLAIVNFPKNFTNHQKKNFAKKILHENRSVKTILEKSEKIKGRLRKTKTNYILGEKTKEALYRENRCVFRFNVDKTYFSPRLSNERKEIAGEIKKNKSVFVMFAGVAPFSVVIAKNSDAKIVYSNEINKEANKYAKLNAELNKVREKVKLIQGDIKRIAKNLEKEKTKFDFIIMPRPQLKDTFLEQAFLLSKKNTKIYYYDFCKLNEIDKIVEKIKNESKIYNKKIKILRIKKAGEIAPYKIRVRVDLVVR